MANFSTNAISGFMAVGRRYTLDIKLHSISHETVLVQIDTSSFDDFIHAWEESRVDIIYCVNAFFGMVFTIGAGPNGCPVHLYDTDFKDVPVLGKDFEAMINLRYALDTNSHEFATETFAAIAAFVRSVNSQTAYDWQGSESPSE